MESWKTCTRKNVKTVNLSEMARNHDKRNEMIKYGHLGSLKCRGVELARLVKDYVPVYKKREYQMTDVVTNSVSSG